MYQTRLLIVSRVFEAKRPFRMTLDQLKIHGGWSRDMGLDTLIKYLMDELDAMQKDTTSHFDPAKEKKQLDLLYNGDVSVEDPVLQELSLAKAQIVDLTYQVNEVKELLVSFVSTHRPQPRQDAPIEGLRLPFPPASSLDPSPVSTNAVDPLLPKGLLPSTPPSQSDDQSTRRIMNGVKRPAMKNWQEMAMAWSTGNKAAGFLKPVKDFTPPERVAYGSDLCSKIKTIGEAREKLSSDVEFIERYGTGNTDNIMKIIRAENKAAKATQSKAN